MDEWPEPDVVRAHLDELARRAAAAAAPRAIDADEAVVGRAPSVGDDDGMGSEEVDGERPAMAFEAVARLPSAVLEAVQRGAAASADLDAVEPTAAPVEAEAEAEATHVSGADGDSAYVGAADVSTEAVEPAEGALALDGVDAEVDAAELGPVSDGVEAAEVDAVEIGPVSADVDGAVLATSDDADAAERVVDEIGPVSGDVDAAVPATFDADVAERPVDGVESAPGGGEPAAGQVDGDEVAPDVEESATGGPVVDGGGARAAPVEPATPTGTPSAVGRATSDLLGSRTAGVAEAGDEIWRRSPSGAGGVSVLDAAVRATYAGTPWMAEVTPAAAGGSAGPDTGGAGRVAAGDDDAVPVGDPADEHDADHGAPTRASTRAEGERRVEPLDAAPTPDGLSGSYAVGMADATVGTDAGDGATEMVAAPAISAAMGAAAVEADPTRPSAAHGATIETAASEASGAVPGEVALTSNEGWTAPVVSTPRPLEQWSVIALVAAVIGATPVTWPVPILSVLGVAFGLVGIHNCQLDRIWRNRWMAVLALGLGVATLVVVMLRTSFGDLHFLPFWTTSD